MKRTAHVTKSTDLHGSGKHGYAAGSLGTGVPPTVVSEAALNPIQEELARAAEAVLGAVGGGYGDLVAALLGAPDAYAAGLSTMEVDAPDVLGAHRM